MFEIKEKLSKKLPCYTSLFIKLPYYDKYIYQYLIQTSNVIYDKDKNEFEFPINKLYFLISFLSNYGEVKFIGYMEKQETQIKCNKNNFKITPYKYQEIGINYGLNNDKWLLLDSMGLGKTMQMICLAEELKSTKKIKHCLIICGVSSLQTTWEKEIQKFSNLSYLLLSKGKTKTGKDKLLSVAERLNKLKNKIDEFFVICNIETLQDKNFVKVFKESKNVFDMIVCDEIHKVKNPQSKSAKTLLKLEAEYMIGLSGTIIMNVPENAYVPLKWTKNINGTFTDFKHMYNVYGGFNNVQVIGYKNLDLLQEIIDKHSLRRLKEDVLELPEKVYQTEYIDLGKDQRQLYDEVAQGIAIELDKLEKKPTILQELAINIRLRQITAFPGMLSSSVNKSAKLERLVDLVEDIVSQGDKVVVFNTFKDAVEEEYKLLKKFNPLCCTGNNTDSEIKINVDKFQNNLENKVMLCTWQKMGTGHTLTAANYCIFVDTPYTRADYDQASDRVHRIGQKKTTFIIDLICNNTYDERVKEIVEGKKELSDFVLDDKTIRSLNLLG